jgi:hypothetical protein
MRSSLALEPPRLACDDNSVDFWVAPGLSLGLDRWSRLPARNPAHLHQRPWSARGHFPLGLVTPSKPIHAKCAGSPLCAQVYSCIICKGAGKYWNPSPCLATCPIPGHGK